MKIDGIAIKGWRSFDEVGATLNNLKKINIIVGLNNVGKSNISRLLRKLKEITANHIEGEKRSRPSTFLEHINLTFPSQNFSDYSAK
jgi:AAA15 family ATPase/GTPase